jgi:DNA invertase Pin-like site-specific DNA recombinase
LSSPACPARCDRSSTSLRWPTSCASGVGLVVLKQHIDTTTPTGRLAFRILGAIDEFQRELIIEDTREGLQAARARGRTGGRKPKLNARQAATVRRMYQAVGPDGKQ